MFDFLLSKEEKEKRIFATNYKVAFSYIPTLCQKVCENQIKPEALSDLSSWKPELKEALGELYYGGAFPEVTFRIKELAGIKFCVAGYQYNAVGMLGEPIYSLVVIDMDHWHYQIACMERYLNTDQYFLCWVDIDEHGNSGILYEGLKIKEFLDQALKMSLKSLVEKSLNKQSEISNNDEVTADNLNFENKYKYVIDQGLYFLDNYRSLSGDARVLAAFYCGSLIWERGGSREPDSKNWHIFRTVSVDYGLWEKFDLMVFHDKAEQLLDLFLAINGDKDRVYKCIYEHTIDEDIRLWANDTDCRAPEGFELALKKCSAIMDIAGNAVRLMVERNYLVDPKVEALVAADEFFLSQTDIIKKIAILYGLRNGGALIDGWVDKSSEELIYRLGYVILIGEEDGVKHLSIPSLESLKEEDLDEKYRGYSEDKRRQFGISYIEKLEKAGFKDNKYRLFPSKEMSGWAIWVFDDKVTEINKEKLLRLAESGNYEAYNNLAVKCQDEDEQLKYFLLAAEHGSSNAQQNLWAHYYNNDEHVSAMKWMKLAAQGGNIYAINNLACCYYWGINIDRDLELACSYYRKLAVMDWDSPDLKYCRALIMDANLTYWVVKKECEDLGIKIPKHEMPMPDKIIERWSLMEFARQYGSPKRAVLTDEKTKEPFVAVIFPTPQELEDGSLRDFIAVSFSKELGELSGAEIAARKHNLEVVLIEGKGYYLRATNDERDGGNKTWSLLEFCKEFGNPRYVEDFRDANGGTYAAMSFDATKFDKRDVPEYEDRDGKVKKLSYIEVRFSNLLPDIRMQYIVEHKRELQVVRLSPSEGNAFPSYILEPVDKTVESTPIKSDKEQRHDNTIDVEDFELPTGGLYTGEAIYNFGMVEITGKGSSTNKDGSKYEGEWFSAHPKGFGTYTFADGDFHKGFFDDLPNGVGYLCLNTERSMKIGMFRNGVMNGWVIGMMPGGIFNCSFLKDGKVVQDHTDDFIWMEFMLHDEVFAAYKGNMVQFSPKNGYIRYGAPKRTGKKQILKFERSAIGFTFANDGTMYVGMVNDIGNLDGKLVKCTPDHKIICGTWKNNEFIKEETMEEVKADTEIRYTFESTKPMDISGE